MPQLSDTYTLALQIEKVRKVIPELVERDDTILSLLEKKTDIEKVSNRAMRLPILVRAGGAGSQGNLDGGALGRGSGDQWEKFTVSPIDLQLACEMTLAADFDTDSGEKAVSSALKAQIINGAKAYRTMVERLAMTAGDGILATNSSGQGTTTVVVDNAQLFTPGMKITSYASGQGTQRTNTNSQTSSIVTAVNYATNTLTLDYAFSSAAVSDVYCIGGLSGATPTSLYGMRYYNNDASSGLVLGLNRATYPEIQVQSVTAGGLLTFSHLRQLLTKIRQRRGKGAIKGGVFMGHIAHTAGLEDQVMQIQSIELMGQGSSSIPDLLKDVEGPLKFAGQPWVDSINYPTAYVDFIVPKVWGRAVVKDADRLKIGDQTVFPVYSTTDGAPLAAFVWYIASRFQIFCQDPPSGGYIKSLSKPVGF